MGFSIKTIWHFFCRDGGSLADGEAKCRVRKCYFVNILTVMDLGPGGRRT